MMRTRRVVAATVIAGLVGAGAVVTPAVLAAGDEEPTPYGPRWSQDGEAAPGPRGEGSARGPWAGGPMAGGGVHGHGPHDGQGPWHDHGGPRGGGMGPGGGWHGDCDGGLTLDQGTLTSPQEQGLAAQAEHEKLTHDVYLALAGATGDVRFERVAQAEQHHLEALRRLMERYGVDDPTAGLQQGEFSDGDAADSYAEYVDAGSDSLEAALEVARELEAADVAALDEAADEVEAADVARVYEHLARSSERHLEVFSD